MVCRRPAGRFRQLLHGRAEQFETDGVFHQFLRIRRGQRLEIGNEIVRPGQIRLSLQIEAAMDRIVRPLEQAQLAVGRQLDAGVGIVRVEMGQPGSGHRDGGRDVVFGLDFACADEILAQLVHAPRTVRLDPDAQKTRHQPPPVVLELVPGIAVHHVDREMLAPVSAPLRAVKTLDHEHQRADVLRNAFQPLVVVLGVFALGGRQQLDHRAQRPFLAQQRAAVAGLRGLRKRLRIIPVENLLHLRQIVMQIAARKTGRK